MKLDFIMESFWQNPQSYNCAAVAMIKVAILHFGVGEVFSYKKRNGIYTIRLRDKKQLRISEVEVKRLNHGTAIMYSRFRNKEKAKQLKELRECVELCFAVMVVFLEVYGFSRRQYSRAEAKEYLLCGYGEDDPFNTDHLYRFLGLRKASSIIKDLRKKDLKKLKRRKACMLYNARHVVAVSDGYYDDYGSREPINNSIPILYGERAAWWYEIK